MALENMLNEMDNAINIVQQSIQNYDTQNQQPNECNNTNQCECGGYFIESQITSCPGCTSPIHQNIFYSYLQLRWTPT